MIIVVHIPKTGGTSFLNYLQSVFGRQLYHHVELLPWWHRLRRRLRGLGRKIPSRTACIFGHFSPDRYAQKYPRGSFGTWLRDPVERIVSWYYYLHRVPNRADPICRRVLDNRLSLREFLQISDLHNGQTKVLADRPLATFDFVGITEHFETSIRLFARVFGLPEPTVIPRINYNPSRQASGYNLDPGLRAYLRMLNRQDEALYRQGLEQFHHLCGQHGLGIDLQPQQKKG